MRNAYVYALVAIVSIIPLSTSAAIDSLNGLTAAAQSLVSPGPNATNTMHMDIIQVGTDKHRFRWDGSPWRVNQGGTGLLGAPLFGELLVGNGLGGYNLLATSSLGITATPGGSNGELQFNDNGVFAGLPLVYSFLGDTVIFTTSELLRLALHTAGGFEFIAYWNEENPSAFTRLIMDDGIDLTISDGVDDGALDLFPGSVVLRSSEYVELLTGPSGFMFRQPSPSILSEVATTTIYFGDTPQNARTCFNTKNTEGDDISFYFVGTTMVVEESFCN
jgi:hypothetical protein